MEMREPRAHEIAREAARCIAEIDETIPVLLEAMVLREIWLTRTLAPSSRRATEISRRRRSGKMFPPTTAIRLSPRADKRCTGFCAGPDATCVIRDAVRTFLAIAIQPHRLTIYGNVANQIGLVGRHPRWSPDRSRQAK